MKVVDNTERSRYELLDGDDLVGFSEYHFHRGEMALLHTEIGDRYGGKGLGSVLVRGLLDDARARGLKVLPYCPFVRGWMTRHPEYLDLVPETHQSLFDPEVG